MARKCIRRKKGKGGVMRCAKFAGVSKGSKGLSGTGAKKRCLKWSKSGKRRCLKRAKR